MDEPETRQGADRAKNQEHSDTDQEHVPQVQHVRREHMCGVQRMKPQDAVQERVKGGASRDEEGVPPPPMVLRTKLVIDQQHSGFGAEDDENEVDSERGTKNVIELIHPQTRHDEKELNKATAKEMIPATHMPTIG